jgi:hypothetical protein
VRTVRILAAVTLFFGPGLSALDNVIHWTVGAAHGNAYHSVLLQQEVSAWHISRHKYTSETRPRWYQRTAHASSPPGLTTAYASSTYVWTRAGMPIQRLVREAP